MDNLKRNDGKLLERVLEDLCSGIENAKVLRDEYVVGKMSGSRRQVDVLIKGKVGFVDVQIEVEAKHYSSPVSIDLVEAFAKKLEDTGSDLGVMVCPAGFQAGAESLAKVYGIQLFEIENEALDNSKLFIPVRLIMPDLSQWSIRIHEKSVAPFYIPSDLSKIRIVKEGREYDLKQLLGYAWNHRMIPQRVGMYKVQFDAVKMLDLDAPGTHQYCELEFDVEVKGSYYLKLFPANLLRNVHGGASNYFLNLPIYTDPEKMRQHWTQFGSMEELNAAAQIDDQPDDVKNLLIIPEYTLDLDGMLMDPTPAILKDPRGPLIPPPTITSPFSAPPPIDSH